MFDLVLRPDVAVWSCVPYTVKSVTFFFRQKNAKFSTITIGFSVPKVTGRAGPAGSRKCAKSTVQKSLKKRFIRLEKCPFLRRFPRSPDVFKNGHKNRPFWCATGVKKAPLELVPCSLLGKQVPNLISNAYVHVVCKIRHLSKIRHSAGEAM